MPKVMTLVDVRSELIKLSRAVAESDKQLNHILVRSGQDGDMALWAISLLIFHWSSWLRMFHPGEKEKFRPDPDVRPLLV
jgi:hypothetical protein